MVAAKFLHYSLKRQLRPVNPSVINGDRTPVHPGPMIRFLTIPIVIGSRIGARNLKNEGCTVDGFKVLDEVLTPTGVIMRAY